MRTLLYTKMELYPGLTEASVIKRAHVLGYELMPFAGWTDADLGYAGNRGSRWGQAQRNTTGLKIVMDSMIKHYPDGTYDAVMILQ